MSTTWLNDREEAPKQTGKQTKTGRWSATARMSVLLAILLVALVGTIAFDVRIVPMLAPHVAGCV